MILERLAEIKPEAVDDKLLCVVDVNYLICKYTVYRRKLDVKDVDPLYVTLGCISHVETISNVRLL